MRPSILSPYIYKPLPSPTSLRLIKIEVAQEVRFWSSLRPRSKTIRISLSSFPLDSAPTFDALSYTWGNPMVSQSRCYSSNQDSTPSVVIEVDQKELLITKSLADALVRIHHTDVSSANGSVKSQYLWADAVCINQQDLEERSLQVAQMDEIYKRARNVLVWLGEEDEFTDDAMATIKIVSAIPIDWHEEVTLADWTNQTVVFKGFGFKAAPSWKNWGGLIMFFRRPWFARVWIIQEVTLGRNCIVLCGEQTLPWESIVRTLGFLYKTGWLRTLSTSWWRRNLPIPWYLRGPYRSLLVGNDDLYIETTPVILTIVRIDNPESLAWFLAGLVRGSKATDPRDKIFSILGLADPKQPPFSSHPGQMVADYTLTVEELYTRTARMLLEGYSLLDALEFVEAKPFRQIPTLPSWVPDYSVDLQPEPWCRTTRLLQPDTFDANNGIQWQVRPTPLDNTELEVQGLFLDTISETIPEISGRNVGRRKAKGNPANELTPFWANIFSFASRISKIQTACTDSKTRFEVLWRTILLDFYDKQHPAPETCGSLFMENIAWSVAGWQHSPWRDQSWYESILMMFKLDDEDRVDSGPKRQLSVRQFETFYAEATAARGRRPDSHRTKFSQLEGEQSISTGMRSKILTKAGRLCLGALSSQPGDEIWILAGSRFPVVLRKVKYGQEHHYTFLGLSFVYGAMNGEAVKTQDDFRTIFLV